MKTIIRFFAVLIFTLAISSFVFGQDTTLTVTSDGKVGIGTPSPKGKLDIDNGETGYRSHFYYPNGNTYIRPSSTGNVIMDRGNVGIGTTNPQGLLDIVNGEEGYASHFYYTDGNTYIRPSSTGNVIMDRGNVGIGTTSPDEKLTLVYDQFIGWEYSPSNSTVAHKIGKSSSGAGPLEFITTFNPGPTGQTFSFKNPSERMTILYNGNVGIGTTSPDEKLTLVYDQFIGWEYSPSNSTVAHKIGKSSSGAGPLEFITTFNPRPTGQTFSFKNPSERMTILYNGNVGIGITTPSHPLEMASGAHVTAGGVWTDASSRELKENIRDLTGDEAARALSQLAPKRYNYKLEKNEEYLGFIAEEVPELVATGSRKNLSPMDIVAVLTRVVQEQQKRIAELEKRIISDR